MSSIAAQDQAKAQLAWEARTRTRATVFAALAALLPIGSFVIQSTVKQPVSPDDTSALIFRNDHVTRFTIASIVGAVGSIFIALTLVHLYRCAKARRPETPSVAQVTAWFGGIGSAVVSVALAIILADKTANFVDHTDRTYEDAKKVIQSTPVVTIQTLGLAVALALGFAFVTVSLNAMRTGLLTRFMGYLGIAVGVLTVIPLGAPSPVLQAFWFLAIAYLLSGRWQSGLPPAWKTGKAEPWPSAQEQAAARAGGRGRPATAGAGGRAGRASASRAQASAPTQSPTATAAPKTRAGSGSKKRKRKKR